MSSLYRNSFVLFLGSILLATQPAAAQRATLEQVKLNATGDFNTLSSGYSFLHHFVAPTSGPTTIFRHVVLDSALHVRHQRDIKLTGRNVELLSYGVNKGAAIYRFRRRQNDSIITAVIDTAGQVLSMSRVARRSYQPRLGEVLPIRADSLFLLYEASSGMRSFRLHCLDLNQRERWQLTFTPRKGRTNMAGFTADGSHAWLVASDNNRSRRQEHSAYCIELKTGKIVSTTLLDYQGERRVACQGLIGPDHSLAVVGRAYQHRRISRVHSGNLFVTRLATDGSRLLDHSNQLAAAPGLLASHSAKTYWQTLVADEAGNLRLVGQTFTSTSFGGNMAIGIATGIATLGFVRLNITTLRPREIVSMQFNPQGGLTQTRVLPLPERNSYTVGGYVPAQLMAELAARAGIFPVRALTPDGKTAVLRTKHQLVLLDLDTQQQRLVRNATDLGTDDVWGVRAGSLMLYRANDRSSNSLDIEQVAYDK
jgi:hypothetical protein